MLHSLPKLATLYLKGDERDRYEAFAKQLSKLKFFGGRSRIDEPRGVTKGQITLLKTCSDSRLKIKIYHY